VKRECYTLWRAEGQTEEAPRVRGTGATELEGIVSASGCDPGERVSDPRRLVPLSPEGDRRQVRRVGLHQQPVSRHQAQQVVVSPLVEGHYPTERHVPAGAKRELRQRVRARVAMHDTDDAASLRLLDERPRVVFRVARVNDYGSLGLGGEGYLGGKRRALGRARRIVVVIVEATLADGDRGVLEKLAKPGNIAPLVECGRVVGMDSRRRENETRIFDREFSCESRHLERLSDADDRRRARIAGAGDYRVAVAGEGRVREVGVAVDED